MKRRIAFVFVAVVACILLAGCGSKAYGLNDKATSKNDNINITVLGIEDQTIDNGELSLSNGDYTKVKITIENTGSEKYTWTSLNFTLGNSVEDLKALTQEDYLPTSVEAGESVTGFIYFPKTDSRELVYKSFNLSNKKQEVITFKLK